MLLAEIEIRHSRAIAPTRRVALGELYLPTDQAPGFGGLLLAGIIASRANSLADDVRDEFDRLLWDVEHSSRVAQPRLRHRFQEDVVGLDRSRHRLLGVDGGLELELDDHGAPLPQVLGAVYAAGKLSLSVRASVFALLRRAARWQGEPGPRLMGYLTGDEAAMRSWQDLGDESWARRVLDFAPDSEPSRDDILARFRLLIREAHPDHGADTDGAGTRVHELSEAKRILLAGA